MSSFYRLAFIPAAGGVVFFLNECAGCYKKVYVITKYVQHRRGYRFSADEGFPVGDPNAARFVPPTMAFLAGAATFYGSKKLMDKVLLSSKPNTSKLFDKLTPADQAKAEFSWKRVWKMIGPETASRSSWRQLGRAHGLAMTSASLALLWAVCVSPVVQVKVECWWAPRGNAMTDTSRANSII
jgi:hypothetical protein